MDEKRRAAFALRPACLALTGAVCYNKMNYAVLRMGE